MSQLPSTSSTAAFRGAVVEDLQLSPALVLPSNTSAGTALRMAFERDFSILPIADPATRRLEGWVSIATLKTQVERDAGLEEDTELCNLKGGALTRFPKNSKYQVITPDTSLEELELFFEEGRTRGVTFALVTDQERKFVLGVVTKEDLDKWIARRMPNGT